MAQILPRDHRGHFKKQAVPLSVRRELAARAGGEVGQTTPTSCAYCGADGSITWYPSGWVYFSDLEMDHVHAEARGGPTVASNLVLACRRCNRKKGARA